MTAQVRAEIARKLGEDYGLTLAEVARQVGIRPPGVEVVKPEFVNLVNYVPNDPLTNRLSQAARRRGDRE